MIIRINPFKCKSPERAENYFKDFERSFSRYVFAKKFCTSEDIVLDVASGSGYGSYYLSRIKNKPEKVIGVELDRSSVDFSISEFKNNNLTFLKRDGLNTEFDSDKFDIIISFETIEHIKDYTKFLVELKRILKKKGKIIISTPNKLITSPHCTIPLHDYHIKEFTIDEFRELLSEQFIIRDIYVQKFYWPKFVIYFRELYARFFSVFGQKKLRFCMKMLHFLIFEILNFNKDNSLLINQKNIDDIDEKKYLNSKYYPQKYQRIDKFFSIQIFICEKE